MKDPDARQGLIDTPQPGDDAPAAITHLQAMKCAAIIDAYTQGHIGYTDATRAVVKFLQVAAIEGTDGPGTCQLTAAELWAELKDYPWPAPGPPRPQPDQPSLPKTP